MTQRIRLVKLVVQPHFVIDDGDTLTESVAQPFTVSAADWPTTPDRLEADRLTQEQALNTDP